MASPGALTFVVGITGHRDIPKPLWPLIKEHVSAQLQQIKANFLIPAGRGRMWSC